MPGRSVAAKLPELHYREPSYAFHQGAPTFQEDLVIPWEGKRLLQAVKDALPKLKPSEPVKLVARVSEGPEQRLEAEKAIGRHAGAGRRQNRSRSKCSARINPVSVG